MMSPTAPHDLERAEFEAARKAVLTLGREAERISAIGVMTELVDEADDLGAEGAAELLKIAQVFQNRRAFALLLVLCLLAGRAGLETPALKQKEVQALIELGRLREAIREATRLADATASDPGNPTANPALLKVWKEAMGNIGRAYKQLYVNAAMAGRTADPVDLREAASAYLKVWQRDRSPSTTYQAINAAALISRAARDRAKDPSGAAWARDEQARQIATAILDIHRDDLLRALTQGSVPDDIWTLATCGEAFLVRGMMQDAAKCYGAYAGNPANTAFNLASSLRQLEQVWEFSGADRTEGGAIVRVLKAALLNLDKSASADERTPENTVQTESVVLSVKEARLMESELNATQDEASQTPAGYEAYFEKRGESEPAGAMLNVTRLAGAVRRSRALCAIETVVQGEWQRIGTGFVVMGEVLNDDWAGQALIVSNHHVTSGGDRTLSSSFQRCRAAFVDLDPFDDTETSQHVGFERVLFERDEAGHDVAVLKPAKPLPKDVVALTPGDVTDYLPPRRAEDRDGTDMNVVILGFPGGKELNFSFGDEMLLDHDACAPGQALVPPLTLDGRPIRLHYRTPSLPGSSGSPVFEAGTWKLIGIHHRGRPNAPRLEPKRETYEANEGIWLASIRAAIGASKGPDAEFFSLAGAARQAGAIAAGSAAVTDLAKQIFNRPIGAAPSVSTPASATTTTQRFEPLPGFVPESGKTPAASPSEIQRLYLKTGAFEGDLNVFRAASSGFETVIGEDNRMQVHHTTADPFRMICSLVIQLKGGFVNYGTGFLIGRSTLVTAGHCLVGYPGAPEVEKIEIRPARAGPNEPFLATFGEIRGERVSVHPSWSERFDPLFDIGAIHLGQPIGDTLGWFRTGAPDPASLPRLWAHVTGYPGDKLGASGLRAPLRAAEMWHHATPIDAVTERQVFYPADTYAGQSGAPVYVIDGDGRPRVVAVHAYGTASGKAGPAQNNNSGVLLDAPMLQILADWRTAR